MGKYYYAFSQTGSKRVLVNKKFFEKNPVVWSARLATGLFGLPTCVSGNRGPKGHGEVILGIGDDGLRRLVELGFIPCPTCKPEWSEPFHLGAISRVLIEKYGIATVEKFADKRFLPFDARRVNYETILPTIRGTPRRMYLPMGLDEREVGAFRARINALHGSGAGRTPRLGYFDASVEGRFTEYATRRSKKPR
jgi:hypothetical protein